MPGIGWGREAGRGRVAVTAGNEPEGDYVLGPLQDSDLAGISDLITRMSADGTSLRLRDKSPAYYRWMYLQNPAGPAVVWSVRQGGRVVASFAIAPKRFQVGGRRVLIGKTMDMFTDPAHQGKGLIRRCTAAVFEQARASGMAGWYVTPSVNSYPIFTGKWGYSEDLRVVFRARILRLAPVLGAVAGPARLLGAVADGLLGMFGRRRLRIPDGFELEELHGFGAEADRLWEEVAPGYPVAQVRDAAYLNWRYLLNPDEYTCLGLRREGRLAGIVVLAETIRRGVRCGEVVDFVCPAGDDESFRLLIDAAVDHSSRRGHALVQMWSVFGTRLDRRIRRAGLRLRRADIKFLLSPDLSDPRLHDPSAWLLTQGDGNDV